MADKYKAVWLSHSSISDFLKCPRAYYLKNVYKDKKTGNKIGIAAAPLSLGSAVHEVIESLSLLPTHQRFETPLIDLYEEAWKKVSGKKGGFLNQEVELEYKKRGEDMINRVRKNPGPLKNLTIKIEDDFPWFWLSEEDNLILCGKVDWLEYLQDSDSVHIIDFKTNKEKNEDPDSLQLPIYHLLVKNTQKRNVAKASYWYIEQSDEPTAKELPDYDESFKKILAIGKKMRLARRLESFECPNGKDGCRECKPYESILNNEYEMVYSDDRRDLYIIDKDTPSKEGKIL